MCFIPLFFAAMLWGTFLSNSLENKGQHELKSILPQAAFIDFNIDSLAIGATFEHSGLSDTCHHLHKKRPGED
jgi:hypothetical protein